MGKHEAEQYEKYVEELFQKAKNLVAAENLFPYFIPHMINQGDSDTKIDEIKKKLEKATTKALEAYKKAATNYKEIPREIIGKAVTVDRKAKKLNKIINKTLKIKEIEKSKYYPHIKQLEKDQIELIKCRVDRDNQGNKLLNNKMDEFFQKVVTEKKDITSILGIENSIKEKKSMSFIRMFSMKKSKSENSKAALNKTVASPSKSK